MRQAALQAAARLNNKVTKLALLEPPFGPADAQAKQEFVEYAKQMSALLAEDKRGDAVAFFLADMVPEEILAGM
jgi:pimeloyl-ACP methyl ester carboxylesterase